MYVLDMSICNYTDEGETKEHKDSGYETLLCDPSDDLSATSSSDVASSVDRKSQEVKQNSDHGMLPKESHQHGSTTAERNGSPACDIENISLESSSCNDEYHTCSTQDCNGEYHTCSTQENIPVSQADTVVFTSVLSQEL